MRRCQRWLAILASSGATSASGDKANRSDSREPKRGDDDDSITAWIKEFSSRAVTAGRQSPEAAAYFQDILLEKPEFADCLREAKRLTGGQNPTEFTPYQRGLFVDRLGQYMSGVAAQKMLQVQQEQQQGQTFAKDGTPTGEQYWYEAGSTLSSPAIPGYVKDDIFHEMQQARRPDSPAFDEPVEVHKMAEEDEGFAEHLRRQKQRLLSVDSLFPEGGRKA